MSDGAPEHFEKWWQAVKLGGFSNDQIMPDHVREAFDLGIMFEREACAKIADAHKGSAARQRLSKTRSRLSTSQHMQDEILAEERGEDIASGLIASAIRERGKT